MATLTITVKDDTGKVIPFAGVMLWNRTQEGVTCPGGWPTDTRVTDGSGKATFYNLNIGDVVDYRVDPVSGYRPDRCHSLEVWRETYTAGVTLYKEATVPSPVILDYDFSPTAVKYLESVDVSVNIRNDGGAGDVYARIYDANTGAELASVVSYFSSGQTKWLSMAFVNFKTSGTINCKLVVGSDVKYFSVNIIEEKPPCSLTEPVITPSSAEVGQTVTIKATLTNGVGADVTSYGDPSYLEFVSESNPPGSPVSTTPATITATYRWRACPPDGYSVMTIGPRMVGCDFTKKATAQCVAVVECTTESFIQSKDSIYETDGASPTLNSYSEVTGKRYRLTISRTPISVRDSGSTTKPLERNYSEIIEGWLIGVDEWREFCQSTGTWYWVMYPARLEEIAVPPKPCITDIDCPSGYICVAGKCIPIVPPPPEEKPKWPIYVGAGAFVAVIALTITKEKRKAK